MTLVPTENTCECPKSHAHTYEGRCRWCFVIAGNRHICDCVQSTAEERAKLNAAFAQAYEKHEGKVRDIVQAEAPITYREST